MVKFLKPGKVVIVLNGRYAGRKAVILKNHDEGQGKRHYGHALIAGVDRYPLKVTKSMTRRKVSRRSKVKTFVKTINYSHVMPTRYTLDLELKNIAKDETLDAEKRTKIKRQIKASFQEKYNSGANKWFFTKLRF